MILLIKLVPIFGASLNNQNYVVEKMNYIALVQYPLTNVKKVVARNVPITQKNLPIVKHKLNLKYQQFQN